MEHRISSTATDVNGNTSTPTTAPYADTQAPVAPTVTVSEADNDGNQQQVVLQNQDQQ